MLCNLVLILLMLYTCLEDLKFLLSLHLFHIDLSIESSIYVWLRMFFLISITFGMLNEFFLFLILRLRMWFLFFFA